MNDIDIDAIRARAETFKRMRKDARLDRFSGRMSAADVSALLAKVDELTATANVRKGQLQAARAHADELTRERDSARDMANAARAQAADLLRALDHANKVVEPAQAWATASRKLHNSPSATAVLAHAAALDALATAVDALPKTEQQDLICGCGIPPEGAPGANGCSPQCMQPIPTEAVAS